MMKMFWVSNRENEMNLQGAARLYLQKEVVVSLGKLNRTSKKKKTNGLKAIAASLILSISLVQSVAILMTAGGG